MTPSFCTFSTPKVTLLYSWHWKRLTLQKYLSRRTSLQKYLSRRTFGVLLVPITRSMRCVLSKTDLLRISGWPARQKSYMVSTILIVASESIVGPWMLISNYYHTTYLHILRYFNSKYYQYGVVQRNVWGIGQSAWIPWDEFGDG